MKIIAKYKSTIIDSNHHAHLNVLVENYRHTQYLSELEQDKEYVIEIKEARSKRSLQQNKLFWKLLHELEKVSKQDLMIWYTHLLEETNCKFEYILGIEGIEEQLKNAFRAVKKVAPREVNGKEVMMYKCYYGSSKYTILEMQELIEILMKYCAEYGIDTELISYE